MTEERNMSHSGPDSDALVTRTYRDLADESAPEHLDRAILKNAAAAARPRYSRLTTWTRPMAWAATVMLSVALVLEVTRLPGPEFTPSADSAGKSEEQSFELDQPDDAPVEILEESFAPAAAPGRSMNGAAVPEAAPIKTTAKQAATEPELEMRRRVDARQGLAVENQVATPAANVDEFKLKDNDMLQRAEDMARRQIGESSEPAPGCDESVTAKPDTWLECIVELEEAGLADEARHQRELLEEAFPDFEQR